MDSFFTRYRNLLVLLAMLMAQIVGLAVQVRRTDEGRSTVDPRDAPGVRLIRLWAEAMVAPPERLIHGSKMPARASVFKPSFNSSKSIYIPPCLHRPSVPAAATSRGFSILTRDRATASSQTWRSSLPMELWARYAMSFRTPPRYSSSTTRPAVRA